MGQVPESKKILVIGNGRVASHWTEYLHQLKIPTVNWYRKLGEELSEDSFDIVFLAVSDAAIPSVFSKYPWLQKTTTVHFSGSNYYDGILGIHPLMTFASELYDFDTYSKIPLAIDFSKDTYLETFSFLPNPVWEIDPNQKAKYHALCVMSGNFPQILWKQIETEIKKLGCPIDGWKQYILKSAENFVQDSNSLTGPLARKDLETIQKNIQSLEGSPLQNLYKIFCQIHGIEVKHENH